MGRFGRVISIVAMVFIMALGLTATADAQKVTLPRSAVQPTFDLNTIKSQLRMGAELGRKVLAGLEAAPQDNAVPLDERLVQDARNTYALIRAAREGMEKQKDRQKTADPLFDLAYKRVTDAWNLARTPVDKYNRGIHERRRYLDISTRDLRRALQLVDQALIQL